MKKTLVLVFAILIFFACLGTAWLAVRETVQIRSELQAQEAAYEVEQPFENHAIDGMVDVAQAGYAANVAIAASGDAAQASMTKSFATAIWGIGFIMVAMYLLLTRKKNEDDD